MRETLTPSSTSGNGQDLGHDLFDRFNPVLRPDHAREILEKKHRAATIAVAPDPGDGWDREPDARRARQLHALKARRARLLNRARTLMTCRTLGGDARIVARLARLGALGAEYQRLAYEIIAIEHY